MQLRGFELLIFDCDGVLIDSEVIASRAVVAELAGLGHTIALDRFTARFVGTSAKDQQAAFEAELGRPLPEDFAGRVAQRIAEGFARDLKSMPGVEEALAALPSARCVASSSTPERLAASLGLTGLLGWFGGNVFSASMVTRGKPAPDLFLFAAAQMGASAQRALVIEDSAPGILAAKAAGMTAWGFIGGSHCPPGHADRLSAAGADAIFRHMRDLPALFAQRNATLTTS